MKRRHVLGGMSAVGGLALAGCSSVLGSGESGTVLGTIEVVNASFTPNRIRLAVERGDDTLVEREIGLTAIDAGDDAALAVVEPVWSETEARYTVRAHHVDDDGDRESSPREYTFTRADYDAYYADSHEDPGCIGAVVRIGDRTETENGAIGIGPTYMAHPCGTPDAE